ncbi:tail fiber domain-containing protein [Runella sp.]|uniref:tail fiber domain-containing protein n=1 Tax=Runella sp. TaxID=1960881 RepID=UPI003D0976B0
MKRNRLKIYALTALAFSTLMANGQIFTQSPVNGSLLITPKGMQGAPYNSTLISNAALGASALSLNTTGDGNAAIGGRTLFSNTTGYYNTATGFEALFSNTEGTRNTAAGSGALYWNKTGYLNTATGHEALFNNRIGYKNTAIGQSAGQKNTAGSNNTFLGFEADAADTNYTNATAIGANATVNASNKIRIGNNAVTVIEGQVAYSFPSDRRLKENILYTNRLGLSFINKLQTVSYSYISDKTHVRHDGFIAQDIEAVMKDLNVPFSGLKKSDDGTYSLAYSDFVMPLVNAVKEQQQQINELKKQNESLTQTVASLEDLKKQNEIIVKRLAALEDLKTETTLRNSDKK